MSKSTNTNTQAVRFIPIQGFEQTDYAWQADRLVWVGDDGAVRHPRNYWNPWQPPAKAYSASLLQAGAKLCLQQIAAVDAPQGLLSWLVGQELPFPLAPAASRFDAVRTALQAGDIQAFEAAALRILGLGNGLTPSGDDFLGGLFFVLAHRPRANWTAAMPALEANICKACEQATNLISAALLSDNMAGASYGQLHDMLDALESNDSRFIAAARNALLQLGASSGADLLTGLLLALTI
jgi:Protein of unknown function (DUF2877)